MAIPWVCLLSPKDYALAGRQVEVPRPDCPRRAVPMTFGNSSGALWTASDYAEQFGRVLAGQGNLPLGMPCSA
jgi:hypothetical protein